MKKFLFIFVCAFALVGLACPANAGMFFGARAGAEKYLIKNTSDQLDEGRTGFFAAGFVGYHASFFRFEGEYTYFPERSFQGKQMKANTQMVMGNLYFSPPMRFFIQPYVMGGAGVSLHKLEQSEVSKKTNAFSWQIGAGLELELSENVFLDVGGRWLNLGDAKLNSKKYSVDGYSYYGGLRFEYQNHKAKIKSSCFVGGLFLS